MPPADSLNPQPLQPQPDHQSDTLLEIGYCLRRNRLAGPAVVELGGFAFQAETQAANGPRVGRRDPPSLAPPLQPKLLVRIFAASEIDLVRAILFESPFDHVHRQQRAERELVEPALMHELVDHRAPMPQDPELRGG